MIDGLPRRNGELAFDAPWQSRVFGLAAVLVDQQLGGDWEPFRQRLIEAVGEAPERPYWESWTVALERLVVSCGLIPGAALDGRLEASR